MACGKSFFFLFALLAIQAIALAEESSDSSTSNSSTSDSTNSGSSTSDSSSSDSSASSSSTSNSSTANSSTSGSSSQATTQDQPANEEGPQHGRDSPFSQLFSGSGSNPFAQIINAFGQFFPGLGGSNSSSNSLPSFGLPFFPSLSGSRRAQEVDGPADDEVASPHDRFFFFHGLQSATVPIGCNYTTQAGYSCAGCREQLLCRTNDVGQLRVCPFYAPYCYNGVCGSIVNTTCTNSTG